VRTSLQICQLLIVCSWTRKAGLRRKALPTKLRSHRECRQALQDALVLWVIGATAWYCCHACWFLQPKSICEFVVSEGLWLHIISTRAGRELMLVVFRWAAAFLCSKTPLSLWRQSHCYIGQVFAWTWIGNCLFVQSSSTSLLSTNAKCWCLLESLEGIIIRSWTGWSLCNGFYGFETELWVHSTLWSFIAYICLVAIIPWTRCYCFMSLIFSFAGAKSVIGRCIFQIKCLLILSWTWNFLSSIMLTLISCRFPNRIFLAAMFTYLNIS